MCSFLLHFGIVVFHPSNVELCFSQDSIPSVGLSIAVLLLFFASFRSARYVYNEVFENVLRLETQNNYKSTSDLEKLVNHKLTRKMSTGCGKKITLIIPILAY